MLVKGIRGSGATGTKAMYGSGQIIKWDVFGLQRTQHQAFLSMTL